jgi:hypothetical protein
MEQTDTPGQDIESLRRLIVDGKPYTLEPLLWQQCKWLGEHIFNGMDLTAIDYPAIHDIGRDRGPLFMAICLSAAGETSRDLAKKPWIEIQARAQEFSWTVTGEEVALFCMRFFLCNPPKQLVMLLTGKQLRQQWEASEGKPSPSPTDSGSSGALSPLATETLPGSAPSSPSGAPLIQIRTSSDASKNEPSTRPSSDGLALSSHGL